MGKWICLLFYSGGGQGLANLEKESLILNDGGGMLRYITGRFASQRNDRPPFLTL